jgi:hypothetical protein
MSHGQDPKLFRSRRDVNSGIHLNARFLSPGSCRTTLLLLTKRLNVSVPDCHCDSAPRGLYEYISAVLGNVLSSGTSRLSNGNTQRRCERNNPVYGTDFKAFIRAVTLRRVTKLNPTPPARANARETVCPAELRRKRRSRIGSRLCVFALTVDELEWSQSMRSVIGQSFLTRWPGSVSFCPAKPKRLTAASS